MKTKYLILWLSMIAFSIKAWGQLNPVRNVPSPEIASLGEYGKIPVSFYTGIPDISIPLYNVKVGDYSLPISISYHTANVKANLPSGSLGLGWSLWAGGYITRTVRGHMDEKQYSLFMHKQSQTFSPGFFDNSYRLKNITNENFYNLSRNCISDNNDNHFELTADEFSFSFCGYSGNFYYNENGGWSVVSDQDIKVVFNADTDGFISREQLGETRIDMTDWGAACDRFFNKFTLITPDGCEYEFGGPNATEFSAPYFNRKNSDLIPTTWRLSKITTAEKKVIEFKYDTSGIVCNIEYMPQYMEIRTSDNLSLPNSFSVGKAGFTGFLQLPVNISQISTQNEVVDFQYNVEKFFSERFTCGVGRKCYLGWRNPDNSPVSRFDIYNYLGLTDAPHDQFHIFLGFLNKSQTSDKEVWDAIKSKLKNLLLSSIKVKKTVHNAPYEEFSFKYIEKISERTKLISVTERSSNTGITASNATLDNGNIIGPPHEIDIIDPSSRVYRFSYNTDMKLPESFIDPAADRWGYWNGSSVNITASDPKVLFGANPKNEMATKADILKQIEYPTGGKTLFEFELHDYSKVLNRNHSELNNMSLSAGGLRIKSIKKLDRNGGVIESKVYHYSTNPNPTLRSQSSGILNDLTSESLKYNFSGKNRNITVLYKSKGGYRIPTTNQNTPDVGYSCVIEEIFNSQDITQGRIRYRFSNYDQDIYGQTHFDDAASYAPMPGYDWMPPYSSRSMERGKLLSEEHFDKRGILKREVKYHYTKTDDSYIITGHQSPIRLDLMSYYGIGAQIVPALTKTYLYRYLLDKTTEVISTDLGGKIEKVQTMEYNDHKLLKKTTTTTSRGDLRTVEYEYNSDDPFFKWSGLDHILNLIAKKTTTENNQKRAEKYEYGSTGDHIPYLSEVAHSINDKSPQTTYKVKSIGSNGKPVVIEEQGVTSLLLWGFGGQRIIAKFVNASLDRLYELPDFSSLDYEDNWESGYEKIERIRQQLPSAQCYVYTYDDRLQLQSIANPNGVTEFFNYDFMGRLIERYYTERTEKGWQKRLLNRYDYNYSL